MTRSALEAMLKHMLGELLDMADSLGELRARIAMLEARHHPHPAGPTASPISSPPGRKPMSIETLLKLGEQMQSLGPAIWRGVLWLAPRAILWWGAMQGLWAAAVRWLQGIVF